MGEFVNLNNDDNLSNGGQTKALILLKHIHNHSILKADVLKHRIPTDEIKQIFLNFFEEGKSPSKALFAFKSNLRNTKGNDYYVYAGDRGELPDPQWVYYLYYKTFKQHFGASYGYAMMTSLAEAVNVYNLESNTNGAAIKVLEDGNFSIAISTPLMQRISFGLEECGEMLFIDASGNIDRYGCKVFVIYTNSCAEGLPVGTIILTSESSSVITEGLQLWKNLFPIDALSKRGEKGPKIFMSDDSAAERHALNDVFPQSTLLLCIFHVLQATWRYLWNSSHGVPLCHRQVLYSKVKDMLYSKSKEQLESTFNNILHEPLIKKYLKFESYITNLYQRKEEWALCYRKGLITRGQNTNNISEAGMKIIKDVILDRTKAYSPVQLFFFIVNELDAFYEMKILDIAANRPAQYLKKKYILTDTQKKDLIFKKLDGYRNIFEVHNNSSNTQYCVDLDVGICSCPKGDTGYPCKHLIFIAKNSNFDLGICLPTSEETRKRLHIIATGCSNIKEGWYSSVKNCDSKLPNNKQDTQNLNDNNVQIALEETDVSCRSDNIHNNNLNLKSICQDVSNCNDFEATIKQFDECIDKMKRAFDSDKTYFLPAIKSFVKSMENNVKTHAGLCSAMETFGKYSGLNPKLKNSKLIGSKRIGTQPTARARRTTQIGGRNNLTAGRTPKWRRVPEHGYTNKLSSSRLPQKKHKSFDPTQLPANIIKTPHSLTRCVEINKALGSTHSSK
uniref:SWIM-type domain-containing protein n=2 Tax=Schizaphis graminum TaxID=13262 RepID=A0A2S2PBP9_SCHGA